MRTYNLKFISGILFAVIFLIGGLLINTRNVDAANDIQTFTLSYSLSPVVSSLNNDGGTTTTVHVGCAYGSGDLFDINTGKRCEYITKSVMVGCAPQSKDLFDINTGKRCTNNSTPVLVGCAAGSGDLFDITNGKRCLNDTKPVIVGCAPGSADIFDVNTGKVCSVNTKKIVTSPILSISPTQKDGNIVAQITQNPKEIVKTTNSLPILSEIKLGENSTTEKESAGILAASAEKIGLILKGPMSIWIILIIAIILLTGGYGIYSLINKNNNKFEAIKPIITPQAKTPNQQISSSNIQNIKPQEQALNKTATQTNPELTPIHQNDHKSPEATPIQETLLKK